MTSHIPIDLYHHPAWVAWQETQGWKLLHAGQGFPVLLREMGAGLSMAYAVPPDLNRQDGFLADDAGSALERLSHRLLPFLPSGCAFIRWDVPANAWRDERGRLIDPRLQELRMNASTSLRSLRKACLEQTCPHTMVVDLRGGEAAVRARFDERTRYSARLARRRGTAVERTGEGAAREFAALYNHTAQRHGLERKTEGDFLGLMRAGKAKGLEIELYLARSDGRPAAGAIFALGSSASWYLFAASSSALRSAAGPTAILADVLCRYAEMGVKRMDLMGVGPKGEEGHPLAGLSRFKSGFGGLRLTKAGAWDYVIQPAAYARCAQAALARQMRRAGAR